MHRIFVYGTLKRGFSNHEEGMRHTTFLGAFQTVERYPLVVAGRWFVPAMMPEAGIGHQVRGELYACDDRQLAVMDRIELTHRPDGYRRHVIEVKSSETGETTTAQVYMRERRFLKPIHSDYLDCYREERYVHPSKRPTDQADTAAPSKNA